MGAPAWEIEAPFAGVNIYFTAGVNANTTVEFASGRNADEGGQGAAALRSNLEEALPPQRRGQGRARVKLLAPKAPATHLDALDRGR